MTSRLFKGWIPTVTVATLTSFLIGCSGADNPQIVEAPAPPKHEDPGPPKIPTRKEGYGANTKYQKAMERLGSQGNK
jgi:hypothetical protein